MSVPFTESDQQLIELLRRSPRTINELIDELGVSANAVRQRLVRLMSCGMLTREKQSEGRGRPRHEYRLSDEGHRSAGNNFPDLAKALWQEIQAIEDPQVRQALMAGAVRRLVETYDIDVSGDSVSDRLNSIEKFYRDRNIPFSVEYGGQLPVLKVLECPYPDIGDTDHQFCEIEKQLFAKVLGTAIDHCRCETEGGTCCSFQAAEPAGRTIESTSE